MTRDEVLKRAASLVLGDRQAQYGDAIDMANAIARRWRRYTERDLAPEEVMRMMAEMKMARIDHDPRHLDSYIDAIGYLALAAEIATGLGTASTDRHLPA
jgi:ABC-type protease/lipase transport system fused ATPase/permease subunit